MVMITQTCAQRNNGTWRIALFAAFHGDDDESGDNDDGDDHDGENDDGELVIISCSAKGPDMIICMIIVIFRMVINESKDYILNINEFIDSGHLVSEKTWE